MNKIFYSIIAFIFCMFHFQNVYAQTPIKTLFVNGVQGEDGNSRPRDLFGVEQGAEVDGVYESVGEAVRDIQTYFRVKSQISIAANTTVPIFGSVAINDYEIHFTGGPGSVVTQGEFQLSDQTFTFNNMLFDGVNLIINSNANVTIDNCQFSETSNQFKNGVSIWLNKPFNSTLQSTLKITNSTFSDAYNAIKIDEGKADVTIQSATFSNNFISISDEHSEGTSVYDSLEIIDVGVGIEISSGPISSSTISNCSIINSTAASAVNVIQGANISIVNTNIHTSENSGIFVSAENVDIDNCFVENCGMNLLSANPSFDDSSGIAVSYGSRNVMIKNCTAENNFGSGIEIAGSNNVQVISANSTGNSSAGVRVNQSDDIRIDGGIISQNNEKSGFLSGGIEFVFTTSAVMNGVSINRNTLASSFMGGGGIAVFQSQVSLYDCEIKDNETNQSGGGIFINSPMQDVFLSGCVIQNNHAGFYGGGLSSDESPNLTIKNSQFIGNKCEYEGGAIFFSGTSTGSFILQENTFTNNTSTLFGGGISILNSVKISLWKNTFNGNLAKTHGGGASFFNVKNIEIGVQKTPNSTIDFPNTFNGNVSHANGGGLYLNLCENVSIEGGNKFIHNRTENVTHQGDPFLAPVGNGGGIYITGSKNIKLNNNDIGMINGGNTAVYNGGGLFIEKSEVTISGGSTGTPGVNVIHNQSLFGNGGGIAIRATDQSDDNSVAIGKVKVQGNQANLEISGGENAESSLGGNGGGIAIFDSDRVNLTGDFSSIIIGSFETNIDPANKNFATANGGGLYIRESSVTMQLLSIIGNESKYGCGGGVAIVGKDDNAQDHSLLELCIIQGNKALGDGLATSFFSYDNRKGSGGGIACLDGADDTQILDCIIGPRFNLQSQNASVYENTARYNGGGIFIDNSRPEIRYSSVRLNKPFNDQLRDAAIYRNQAKSGGGIFARNVSMTSSVPFEVNNARIISNTAEEYGGGIAVVNESNSVIIYSATIEYNIANNAGGGLYVRNSNPRIGQVDGTPFHPGRGGATVIANNRSTWDGGGMAIYSNSATSTVRAKLQGLVVHSNQSVEGNGGGIAFHENAHDIELTQSLIGLDENGNAKGNKAPKGAGGGLYFNDSTPFIGGPMKLDKRSAVNFIQYNQASSGGGTAAQNSSAARLLGNWIAFNKADVYGGGFLCDNASIQIGPSTPSPYPVSDFFAGGNFIENNSARYGGGGAIINQSDAKIRWNIIENNALVGDDVSTGGLYVEGMNAKPQITNNDLIQNQGDGVSAVMASIPAIENNIFDSNTGYGVHAPDLNDLSHGGTIGSNCFFNNTLGPNSPTTINLNQDFDVLRANFKKDPQFINRASKDYRLGSQSPCLPALSPKDSLHIGALPGNLPKFDQVSDKLANLRDADFGDIDGDGLIDVAVVSNTIDLVILNTGGGVFSTSKTIYVPSSGSKVSHAIELGDLDHDGDLDVVVANEAADILAINQGQNFKANKNIFDPPVVSHNVKLADLNGDDNLDAVFAREGQNPIFFGDGAGSFTTPGYEIGGEFSDTRDIAVGDLDADGDLDLYFANYGQDEIWLNDGKGGFAISKSASASTNAEKITIGDLDLDGDLDIFLIAFGSNQILLNNGHAIFSESALPDELNRVLIDADFADINLDGYLDIIAAAPDHFIQFINRGNMTFDLIAADPVEDELYQVDAADPDRDGILETVIVRKTRLEFVDSLQGVSSTLLAIQRIAPTVSPAGSSMTITSNGFSPSVRSATASINNRTVKTFLVNISQSSFVIPEDMSDGNFDLTLEFDEYTRGQIKTEVGPLNVTISDWALY